MNIHVPVQKHTQAHTMAAVFFYCLRCCFVHALHCTYTCIIIYMVCAYYANCMYILCMTWQCLYFLFHYAYDMHGSKESVYFTRHKIYSECTLVVNDKRCCLLCQQLETAPQFAPPHTHTTFEPTCTSTHHTIHLCLIIGGNWLPWNQCYNVLIWNTV